MQLVGALLVLLCAASVLAAGGGSESDLKRRGVDNQGPVTCSVDANNGLTFTYTCYPVDYDLKIGKKEDLVGSVQLTPTCVDGSFEVDFEAAFSFCNAWTDEGCEATGKCFKDISWQLAEFDPQARKPARELKKLKRALARTGNYPHKVNWDTCGYGPNEEAEPSVLNFTWLDDASLYDADLSKICVYMGGHANLRTYLDKCGVNQDCLRSSRGIDKCVNYSPINARGNFNSYWSIDFLRGGQDSCNNDIICNEENHPQCGEISHTYEGWCADTADSINAQCRHGRLVSSLDIYEKYLAEGDAGEYPVDNPENLLAINYLLNAKRRSYGKELQCGNNLSWRQYQHAIWILLDFDDYNARCRSSGCGAGSFDSANGDEGTVDCLVNAAIDGAQRWKPQCDGVFAAVLVNSKCGECGEETVYGAGDKQDLLVVYPIQEWGCKCVRQSRMKQAFVYGQCDLVDDPCYDEDICTTGCPEYAPMRNEHGECVVSPSKWKPYFEYCCEVTVEGDLITPPPPPPECPTHP